MIANHPFAATRRQMRKPIQDGGGYASLSDDQRWEYHADVYAFRRVFLDVPPDERSWGGDTSGVFFDEDRVRLAERFYRQHFKRPLPKPDEERRFA